MPLGWRRRAVLAGTLPACRPCALELNPSLDISQYAHKPWKVSEGCTKGFINDIAQTPDGFLWLGTESGLVFRAAPWRARRWRSRRLDTWHSWTIRNRAGAGEAGALHRLTTIG
jgi:hypothetical protein